MTHSGSFSVTRSPEEVFDLLSNPEWFAPVMPDFESMAIHDATHFTMRTAIAIGQIKGHATLAMELLRSSRPGRVEYRGSATIASSSLSLAIEFQIDPRDEMTDVSWRGEVTLDGRVPLMAGALAETIGRQNFGRMAENLQVSLHRGTDDTSTDSWNIAAPSEPDFDI